MCWSTRKSPLYRAPATAHTHTTSTEIRIAQHHNIGAVPRISTTCVVEIETTATNMGFFGSNGILSHEIQYTAIDEQDCRNIASQLQAGTHKLLKVGPYTYTNTTHNSITYQWCCRDHKQHNYKLIVRQLYATYNYCTSRFFSPNLPLAE